MEPQTPIACPRCKRLAVRVEVVHLEGGSWLRRVCAVCDYRVPPFHPKPEEVTPS